MGYYTDYSLQIYDAEGNDATEEIKCERDIDDIIKDSENYREDVFKAAKTLKYAEDDWCYGILMEERCKWYDYEKDMKKLSKMFPNLVFVLHGDGEESGDMWTTYFCNGRSNTVRPELKWPYFDIKSFGGYQ